MPAMGVGSAWSRPLYHSQPCITTRKCASGSSPRSPPEALVASPAAAEEAIAAMGVLPRLPLKRMARLLPLTSRAPAPLLLPRHHHTAVGKRHPTTTSPTRTWAWRRKRRRTWALPGRAPATRRVKAVAATRPTSAYSAASLPMSLNSCILSIKDLVA